MEKVHHHQTPFGLDLKLRRIKKASADFPPPFFFPTRETSVLLFARELELNLQKILPAIQQRQEKAELQFFFSKCKEMLIRTVYNHQVLPAGPKNSSPYQTQFWNIFHCYTSFCIWSALLNWYSLSQNKIQLISYGHLILFFLQIFLLLSYT